QRATGMPDVMVSDEALVMAPDEFKRLVQQASAGRSAEDAAHTIPRAVWRPYYINLVKVDGVPGTHPEPVFYPTVNDKHPSDRLLPGEYFMLGDNSLQSLDS